MNITFRKSISGNHMIFENANRVFKPSFEEKMLSSNDIGVFLPLRKESVDGDAKILFDISGLQSFRKIYEVERLSYSAVCEIVTSLKKMSDLIKEYLLEPNSVVLKKECIFVNQKTGEYKFCYFPGYFGDLKKDISELFEFMRSSADYNDDKAMRTVCDLCDVVLREDFVVEDLYAKVRSDYEGILRGEEFNEEFFSEISEEKQNYPEPFPEEAEEYEYAAAPPGFFEKLRRYLKGRTLTDIVEDIDNGEFLSKFRNPPLSEKILRPLEDELSQIRENTFNPDFSGFKEENATTILTPDMMEGRRLVGINRRKGQIIELNSFPFTLGKVGDADEILDDPTVSKLHARIYHEDGTYYIEDLNSKNGTFINELEIESYTRYSLMPGDVIRLAREEFCFR